MEKVSDNATRRGTEAWVVGLVVLMKHEALESGNCVPNGTDELTGRVSLRLISSDHSDPHNGKGKMGEPAYLEEVFTQFPTAPGETAYKVTFHWSVAIGFPGAFTIRNEHGCHFYLRTLTIDRIPSIGRVHFVCNSWVYPADKYHKDRLFFANKTYLPRQTPPPLMMYRQEELMTLRGNGTGELKEWDRVYDYDVYNDLGDPDESEAHSRPILGGSTQYPYPRRGRTGRPPTKTDPNSESRLPMELSMSIYVPRDERFSAVKSSNVSMLERLEDIFNANVGEFNSFKDVLKLYEVGIRAPDSASFEKVKDEVSPDVLSELFSSEASQGLLKFPMPQVIEADRSAWRTDEEFAREMLAGVNPVVIRRLQEFPPRSTLDPNTYGNQHSTITKGHIESGLDSLTVDEAIDRNRLFILDHHDGFMPYLRRINSTSSKVYATRTVLFLKEDGTLKPLAIELSLPHPQGDRLGAVSKVFQPAQEGVAGSIWELAKAYVAVNDSGFHQLISHFLNTHAIVEPYVIATNRHLSTLHPIYKLLHPHFKDTMNINALARQTLINAGGILENTFFPGKYSMELSSAVYKSWVFSEQALPTDLIKRGVAVEDPNSNHGIRLLIEDYPYAVDGLEIWSAIKTWVGEYCHFYYHHDTMVQQDMELQLWWKEIVDIGHGDKNNTEGLLPIISVRNLIDSCTIIIWIASALHAAVNFGQYSYGGFMPNRPSLSRKFMPEIGTADYEKLREDPEKAFLETITSALPTLMGISMIEVLSSHSPDEVYLGQRDSPEWTTDEVPLKSLEKFNKKLEQIEKRIVAMNDNPNWRNRVGPVKVPYTLQYRTSEPGLTGMGIPNSVSI